MLQLSITQAKSDEEALKRKAQEMMKKAKDLTGVSSPDQLSHDIREVSNFNKMVIIKKLLKNVLIF